MIDPVLPEDFPAVFFSAAAVVLAGAGYAALFAWSGVKNKPRLLIWAYACYGLLAGATFLLARVAHLNGEWQFLVVLMLIGYLLAPIGIWNLCQASHRG